MAVPIYFSSLAPAGDVVEGTQDASTYPTLKLTLSPEPSADGSSMGRPVVAAMTDAVGTVLPQFARLYQVRLVDRTEIPGTEVPLLVSLQASAFANGLPAEPVTYTLTFNPQQPLLEFTLYDFSYDLTLPGEYLPANLLTYLSTPAA